MRVGLGIPFWGDEPHRKRNYNFTFFHMIEMFPWSAYCLNMGEMPQNRGAARNFIVRELGKRLKPTGVDVVVICDADTFCSKEGLEAAIEGAYRDGGLHFPYDSYKYLNEVGTQAVMDGRWDTAYTECDMEGPGSYGGIMAMRPSEWWECGGSPELSGWGFEDIVFAIQARTLLPRDITWHSGRLTHLWHPSDVDTSSDQYKHNIGVCKRFEAVDRDPGAVRALMMMGIGNHATR